MLALLLVAALPGMPAAAPPLHARESAAEVREALRAMGGIRTALPAPGPVRIYVVVPELTPERRTALEAAGLAIELPPPGAPAPAWRAGVVVQGTATAAARAAIARLPFVRAVESAGEAWPSAGAVQTVGDTILGSAAARDVLGRDGTGVTVGVISDGVDGRAGSIASGDLPADLELPSLPGLSSPSGNEGTAVLEIVHDVAPGAHLLFAPAHTSVEMVVAIAGLVAAGAQVILDDLVFTDEPKFEDGPIAQAARQFASTGGVYVTAAGNYARAHYFGAYARGGGRTFAGLPYAAVHDFAGSDFGNSFRLPAGADMLAVLQWNDPFGQAGDDFDLVLVRPASGGDVVVGTSTDQQNGAGNPFEAVRYTNSSGATEDLYLAVGEFHHVTDVARLRLNLMVFSSSAITLEHADASEAIFGHGAVEQVLSVAAADAARPVAVESFSSNGPATVFFPTPSLRQVPRLTGVDHVETAVGSRGEFPNPFFGTSAAAPHVAGCAALLIAAGFPADTIRSAVITTASDLAPAGFDAASGAGLLDCAAAARLASGNVHAPVVDSVAGGFDAGAGVTIQTTGHDDDGDARTAVVRVLDAAGRELARQEVAVAGSGTALVAAARLRASALARARAVAASAHDAIGLDSVEVTAMLACPEDGSFGDALCGIGDLLSLLDPEPGRRARRAEQQVRRAAAAVVRTGRAHDAGRGRRVRHGVTVAVARLGAVMRLVRRLSPEIDAAVTTRAETLRTRLRVAAQLSAARRAAPAPAPRARCRDSLPPGPRPAGP